MTLTPDGELLEVAMGTLRQRLAGVGQGMFSEIEAVFRDGLRAKKAVQITRPHCAKRSRHYLADMAVRLSTTKLILGRLVSPAQSASGEETYVDPSGSFDHLTTAQLRALVFPPEQTS